MITAPVLARWLLSLAPLLDRTPRHSPIYLPEDFAPVIAQVAIDTAESMPGIDPVLLASTLRVLGAYESTYRANVVGDNGKSCGLFQTRCMETPMPETGKKPTLKVVLAQTRLAVKWILVSWRECPQWPLAMYASGSICGKIEVVEQYMTHIRFSMQTPPPSDD